MIPVIPASMTIFRRRFGTYHLEKNFIFLGVIPYKDVLGLMRAAVAVINPSVMEGWSTTVEEAKSLGLPLILSDIPVHREQATTVRRFL